MTSIRISLLYSFFCSVEASLLFLKQAMVFIKHTRPTAFLNKSGCSHLKTSELTVRCAWNALPGTIRKTCSLTSLRSSPQIHYPSEEFLLQLKLQLALTETVLPIFISCVYHYLAHPYILFYFLINLFPIPTCMLHEGRNFCLCHSLVAPVPGIVPDT